MDNIITSTDVINFLNDVAQNSVTEILEGEEANELIGIAKKRGIILKGNSDLAGFKNIYAITDKANKNKCRLPYEIVEKSLDTIIDKPVDIDHIRKYVVGHYIDKKLDGKKIITYGVFYKSNFDTEWEQAKKLFKEGKLTTSFEIHCPTENREYHKDGTYSLNKMEFAGGGILFKTKPAYPEAVVLELAKQRMDDTNGIAKDLIYASGDLLTSNVEEDSLEKEMEEAELPKEVTDCVKKKVKDGTKSTDAVKQCWIEYKKKTKANIDNLVDKFDRKEEKKDMETLEVSLNVFDLDLVSRMVSGMECPKCKESEKSGYLYLVGIDFEDKKAFLRCNVCEVKYSADLVLKPKVVQATEILEDEIIADVEDLEKFEVELISTVEDEIEEEAARLTYEQKQALPDSDFAVIVVVKKKKGEGTRKIRMFPINDAAHVRNALARLGQPKPKATLKSLSVKIDDVYTKVLKKAKDLGLDDLLRRNEDLCKRLGIGVPKAKASENPGKGENKSVDEKTKEELAEKSSLPENKDKEIKEETKIEDKKPEEEVKDIKIKELETKIAALEKTIEENKVDIEKIKTDTIKVFKLREEFGDYAKDIKDEELLDEKKLGELKVKKENDELKAEVEKLNKKLEKANIKEDEETGHTEIVEAISEETKKIDKSAYGKSR